MLQIKDPCSEDFSKMIKKHQGAFCSKCQKDVIDVSNRTHEEVLDIISQYFHEGNTCIRIEQKQSEDFNHDFNQWRFRRQQSKFINLFVLLVVFWVTIISCKRIEDKKEQ